MIMLILFPIDYCVIFNVWEQGYLSQQTSDSTKAKFWMTGREMDISVSHCVLNRPGARSLLSDRQDEGSRVTST
jgi:hypothetical protein